MSQTRRSPQACEPSLFIGIGTAADLLLLGACLAITTGIRFNP